MLHLTILLLTLFVQIDVVMINHYHISHVFKAWDMWQSYNMPCQSVQEFVCLVFLLIVLIV